MADVDVDDFLGARRRLAAIRPREAAIGRRLVLDRGRGPQVAIGHGRRRGGSLWEFSPYLTVKGTLPMLLFGQRMEKIVTDFFDFRISSIRILISFYKMADLMLMLSLRRIFPSFSSPWFWTPSSSGYGAGAPIWEIRPSIAVIPGQEHEFLLWSGFKTRTNFFWSTLIKWRTLMLMLFISRTSSFGGEGQSLVGQLRWGRSCCGHIFLQLWLEFPLT